MAKVLVQHENRSYVRRTIYRNVGKTKYEAYVMVPETPEFKTDDEAMAWLHEAVESGVLSYRKVVSWALKQVPILGGGPAFSGLDNNEKKTMTIAEMVEMYAFSDRAKEALGNKADDPALLVETMKKMWLDSKKVSVVDWKPEDHVVFPKNIDA